MLDEDNGLFYYDDRIISLSPTEAELLGYLIDKKPKLVPVERLAIKFFGESTFHTDECITNTVYRINFKLYGILKITMRR